MKFKLFLLMTLYTSLAFSQQEASVWYFGENAGLKFNTDGSVNSLGDGKLNSLAFSQQEASVWYFGKNAGLKFQADGSVAALIDGQLDPLWCSFATSTYLLV